MNFVTILPRINATPKGDSGLFTIILGRCPKPRRYALAIAQPSLPALR